MKNEYLDREIADRITYADSGETHSLTYKGAGSNCQVYSTEGGDIIKEFLPIIAGNVTMSRKDNKNKPLTVIESLPDNYKKIVKERFNKFCAEEEIVKKLNQAFQADKNNMLIAPEFLNTSLGYCQRYRSVSGEVFSEHLQTLKYDRRGKLKPFSKRFAQILPYFIKLFHQVEIYHKANILNLDIKPDNLIAVNFDDYKGLRNIDFGSTMEIDTLLEEMERFAEENSELGTKSLCVQISTKFFASSVPYYDKYRIEGCIENFLNKRVSREEMIRSLKQLDVIAAWKSFLYAMCESEELWLEAAFGEYSDDKQYIGEGDVFFNLFLKLFIENEITGLGSLFADYNVFYKLYELSKRVFASGRGFLGAQEICVILGDILCIIKGSERGSGKSSRQIAAENYNRSLMNKDGFLEERGLVTVADILEFCQGGDTDSGAAVRKYPKPGELYLYLLLN